MTMLTVDQGTLHGLERDGIHAFKGVPYAAPTSGANRWRPPQPPSPWLDVRDATSPGKVCAQPIINAPRWLLGRGANLYMSMANVTEPSGDDCLNLNVWTPAPDREAKLPVMFWIHGGGSIQGSGTMPAYDGTQLAKKGVVVVTINYRLGLAGFLAAPDYFDGDFCAPNRGYLDQVAALNWVSENVSHFGGDPTNVTIFGESAGATSVSALLSSPASKGLFQRAIVMSGSVESGASLTDHQAMAADFFGRINVKKGDKEALSHASGAQVVEWFDCADKIARSSPEKYGGLSRGIGGAPNAFHTPFLPAPNLDAIVDGRTKGIDLMLGTMRDEARLFSMMMPGPMRLGSRLSLRAFESWLGTNRSAKEFVSEYKRIMPDASRHHIREEVVSDAVFRRGTMRAALAHAETNPGKTFLYQIDRPSSALNGAFGAIHGLEVGMVFNNMDSNEAMLDDSEETRAFADTISEAWVNFAKHGKPSANGIPEWEAFDSSNRASMVLNTHSEIRYGTDGDKLPIWGERQAGSPV